jgi:hypothetical protein
MIAFVSVSLRSPYSNAMSGVVTRVARKMKKPSTRTEVPAITLRRAGPRFLIISMKLFTPNRLSLPNKSGPNAPDRTPALTRGIGPCRKGLGRGRSCRPRLGAFRPVVVRVGLLPHFRRSA